MVVGRGYGVPIREVPYAADGTTARTGVVGFTEEVGDGTAGSKLFSQGFDGRDIVWWAWV